MVKKMAAVLTGIIVAAVAFGCGGAKPNGVTVPEYDNQLEMMIGGWNSPVVTLADYQLAKDMGLTHMFVDEALGLRGTPNFVRNLEYCEAVGLKAIVSMGNAMSQESTTVDNTDYSQYPAVTAINYWDEPSDAILPQVAELAEQHMTRYGDKLMFYANLLPNDATSYFGGLTFEEHVNKYCSDVLGKLTSGTKMLSCDIYPLVYKSGVHSLKSTWLAGVERIAIAANANGAESHFFIQATEHYSYPAATEQSLRYQFFVNMAFGIRSFTYFTYAGSVASGWGKPLVSKDQSCKTYPAYEYAKTVNAELKALQSIYLSYKWLGTLPVIGTDNEEETNTNFAGLSDPLERISFIKRQLASQDTLMGEFVDADGRNGLLVTNFSNPFDDQSDVVKIEFNNAKKVAMYTKGIEKIYNLKDNVIEFKLEPGQGAFLIPLA
ncbi:MAG: hypothetical protein LBS99_06630 [Clostridiales bacterium]|jgi:hypothetical protein|nr:hypothetical protein [Clostridiales bacterium]